MKSLFGFIWTAIKLILGTILTVGLVGLMLGMLIGMAVAL